MDMLNQQLNFILELDRLKGVYRQALVKSDQNRRENSAEHSWHIALLAQVLQQYADRPVNIHRVVTMLLLHDIVEIDAGDTFAFANAEQLAAQPEKELRAAERLFGLLPASQAQQMKQLWLEFEQVETADAQFAKAMDSVMPLLQNMANEGGSWVRHTVTKNQVLQRNKHLKTAAPKLWDYVYQQIELATNNGWLSDS